MNKLEAWQQIRVQAGIEGLKAFNQVWYERKHLLPEQREKLKRVFEKVSLDAPDFNTWLKQRVRQLYEGASRGSVNS